MILFNEKKIVKYLVNFWHRKLTLKVRNWHFLITWFRADVDLKKVFYEKALFFNQLGYHLMRKLIKYSFKWLSIAYKTYNWVVQRTHFLESWVLPQVPDEAKTCAWSILQFAWIRNRTLDIQISNFLLGQRSFDKLNCRKVWICQKNKLKLFRLLSTYIQYAKFWKFFVKLIVAYPQYHLIRTTVNFLVVMVLIFSQNFSSNGPYVVVNFCNFSDRDSPRVSK